jgi:hypothetical protein
MRGRSEHPQAGTRTKRKNVLANYTTAHSLIEAMMR